MILFPAIDIRNGKCVRLIQGDYNKENVYGDPVEMAHRWLRKGASWLHIVDLDGALKGSSQNIQTIKKIVDAVNIPIQVGGGIRSMEQLANLRDIGVNRVILGSAALHDERFLDEALAAYPEAIAVSVDGKQGYVATDGWTKISAEKVLNFVKRLEDKGLQTIVYTDIEKDGMLSGPNVQALNSVNSSTTMNVIAAGGVSSVEDVKQLSKLQLYGTIIGKALYTGQIELEAALQEVMEC